MLDYGELERLAKEGDGEPVETTVDELQGSDLSGLPEGIVLSIFESEFPETLLWHEGDVIISEITEHIYTKYWWHKYHAHVFAEAMERAVLRLQHQGHPFKEPSLESDDVHLFIRWQVVLPQSTSGRNMIKAIRTAFDLVWERANSILENSDSVLILGKDSGKGLARLKKIASVLEGMGYYPYIIKEQPDRIGEGVIQKVLRYALSSKFIVVENSEAAGHLYELPHISKMAECVTVILEEEGKGSTWMFQDAYGKHKHWREFQYKPETFVATIKTAVQWAEQFVKEFGQFQREALPWLQRSEQKPTDHKNI